MCGSFLLFSLGLRLSREGCQSSKSDRALAVESFNYSWKLWRAWEQFSFSLSSPKLQLLVLFIFQTKYRIQFSFSISECVVRVFVFIWTLFRARQFCVLDFLLSRCTSELLNIDSNCSTNCSAYIWWAWCFFKHTYSSSYKRYHS